MQRQRRMVKRWHATGIALFAMMQPIRAGEFTGSGFAVDVPDGFEGPLSTRIDAQSETHAFTTTTKGAASETVLQFTSVKTGGNNGGHEGAELVTIAKRYLLQMLQGIERRRTDFRRSDPGPTELGGVSGARVSWTGKANGLDTNGEIFCVVSDPEFLFVHVMGSGASPNPDMVAAIMALKTLRMVNRESRTQ